MKNVTSCYNRVKCKWFMKVLQCILIIYYNKRFNFELCMYVILFWSYILSLSISSLCMFQVWFWKKWFQNTFLLLTSNFWILEWSIQWKTPKEKTLKLWMNKNITKENNGVFFCKIYKCNKRLIKKKLKENVCITLNLNEFIIASTGTYVLSNKYPNFH